MQELFRTIAIVIAMICLFCVSSSLITDETAVSNSMKQWTAGTQVTEKDIAAFGENNCFAAEKISDKVFSRMNNKSYKPGCPIGRDQLRYLKLLHKDAKGRIFLGEMVVNREIASDVVEIFHKLYKANYPIERMLLIDNYNANDEQSMRDNNTSAFCFRPVKGTKILSAHSRGMAIDINTLYNPYEKIRKDGTRIVQPSTATQYCDRTKSFPYKIEKGDLCHRLFIEKGFSWGGSWKSCKDYQHFEK